MSKTGSKPRQPSAAKKTKPSNVKAKPKPSPIPSMEAMEKELAGCRAELCCLRAKFDLKALEQFQIEEQTTEAMLLDAVKNAVTDLKRYQEAESGPNDSGNVADKEELKKLGKDLKNINEEKSVLQSRCNELELQLKTLQNELKLPAIDKNQIEKLKKQIEDLRSENEKLSAKQKSMDSKLLPIIDAGPSDADPRQIVQLQEDLKKSRDLNEEMANRVNEKEKTEEQLLAKAKREHSASQQKLTDQQKELSKQLDVIEDMKKKLQQAEDEMKQLKNAKPSEAPQPSTINREQTDELAKVKSDHSASQQKLTDQQKEINQMQVLLSTFKTKHADHEAVKKELKNTEKLYSNLMERYEAERHVRDKARAQIETLETEIKTLKRKHSEEIEGHEAKHAKFSVDFKSLITEKDGILKELELLKSSRDISLPNTSELEDVRQLLQTEKSAHERTKKLKEDLEHSCHEAFEQLEKKEKETKQLEKKHKETIDRKDKTISDLRKEKTTVDPRPSSSKTLQNKLAIAEKQLREAEEETDTLKNRLSKMAGAQLMDNNPNIADLSDENRPTKLGEKYSELYDNEWTDAFEDVEKVLGSEEGTVKHLYTILTDVYTFCQSLSKKHSASVKSTALNIPEGQSVSEANAKLNPSQSRLLKEVRKGFAPYQLEAVFQLFKKMQKPKHSEGANADRYIRKSVEICWFMSVQDPPVVIDTKGKPGGRFDTDSFRTYTRTGKTIDFVVWPPLLLHEGGPMLSKGVAQGK